MKNFRPLAVLFIKNFFFFQFLAIATLNMNSISKLYSGFLLVSAGFQVFKNLRNQKPESSYYRTLFILKAVDALGPTLHMFGALQMHPNSFHCFLFTSPSFSRRFPMPLARFSSALYMLTQHPPWPFGSGSTFFVPFYSSWTS